MIEEYMPTKPEGLPTTYEGLTVLMNSKKRITDKYYYERAKSLLELIDGLGDNGNSDIWGYSYELDIQVQIWEDEDYEDDYDPYAAEDAEGERRLEEQQVARHYGE